jgi:hypothetical protein
MASGPCLSWPKPVLKTATVSTTTTRRAFVNRPIFCWHYLSDFAETADIYAVICDFIGLSDKNLKVSPSFAD